jgi:hypothetical protein
MPSEANVGLIGTQVGDAGRQPCGAPPPGLGDLGSTGVSQVDEHLPSIVGMWGADEQPRLNQAGDRPGHRRGLHMVELGQCPGGLRSGTGHPVEHRVLAVADDVTGPVLANLAYGTGQRHPQVGGQLGRVGGVVGG